MVNRFWVLLGFVLAAAASAYWGLDLEAGPVFSGYNDVRIPGDSGTLFSLTDDLNARTEFAFRARLSKAFGDRHWVSLLVAPLRVRSRGTFDREVFFAGVGFSPGTEELDALYRFDSYRLTWRYLVVRSERFRLSLGLTAKVRDAEISLRYVGVRLPPAKKTNTGFVPLVSFRAEWRFGPRAALAVDGDALGVPQGRAEDVTAAVQLAVTDRLDARVGYRVLEGGSDVDEVYGFALFHYAVAGVAFHL